MKIVNKKSASNFTARSNLQFPIARSLARLLYHSALEQSLFYVIENPEEKIGYIPRLKIAQGIYLGNTIVENVSGKVYLNIISTLNEDVEVQVPILRLLLNELFDNYGLNKGVQNHQEEITNMQPNLEHPGDDRIDCRTIDRTNEEKTRNNFNNGNKDTNNNCDQTNLNDDEDETMNENKNEMRGTEMERKIKNKTTNKN